MAQRYRHLHRYLTEFDFRYNAREVSEVRRSGRASGDSEADVPDRWG
jgi:hypothetical protein